MRSSATAFAAVLATLWLGVCSAIEAADIEEWLAALESSDHVETAILARIEAEGGTPLTDDGRFWFFARSRAGEEPRIIGDFNDGGYDGSGAFGDGGMRRIGTSKWFVLVPELPMDVQFGYRIQWGDDATPDALNPLRVTTMGTERSVVRGPAALRAPRPPEDAPRGHLERFQLRSSIRGNDRGVLVYVPPSYAADGPRLPTLYVKDGHQFVDQADMPSILDALIAARRMPPVLAVFVDPVGRALEYGTYSQYRRLVVEELVPEVERRFASGGSPEHRALLGWSRGGLAVVDLLLRHPDVFGVAAAISPATEPLPIVEAIATAPTPAGHSLVFTARFDTPSLRRQGRALADALEARGASVTRVELPIDHSIPSLEPWIDRMLFAWIEAR